MDSMARRHNGNGQGNGNGRGSLLPIQSHLAEDDALGSHLIAPDQPAGPGLLWNDAASTPAAAAVATGMLGAELNVGLRAADAWKQHSEQADPAAAPPPAWITPAEAAAAADAEAEAEAELDAAVRITLSPVATAVTAPSPSAGSSVSAVPFPVSDFPSSSFSPGFAFRSAPSSVLSESAAVAPTSASASSQAQSALLAPAPSLRSHHEANTDNNGTGT